MDDNYLKEKISVLKEFNVERLLLSPHDSSDYALDYFKHNLNADIKIIKSGKKYDF